MEKITIKKQIDYFYELVINLVTNKQQNTESHR